MSGRSARDTLLLDHRAQLLVRLPACREQPQPEILVLGQAVAPRTIDVDDVIQRGQAVELPVAAHPRGADAVPPAW